MALLLIHCGHQAFADAGRRSAQPPARALAIVHVLGRSAAGGGSRSGIAIVAPATACAAADATAGGRTRSRWERGRRELGPVSTRSPDILAQLRAFSEVNRRAVRDTASSSLSRSSTARSIIRRGLAHAARRTAADRSSHGSACTTTSRRETRLGGLDHYCSVALASG